MRSTARIVLYVLGALFGALAIVFALGAWRLSSGPLSLGFLSPYIEEALQDENLSYRIAFEDTVLVWAGWGKSLEVRLTDVLIADAGGKTLAEVPTAALGMSGAALLRGVVAPTSIELRRLRLALVRDRDGQIGLAGSDDGSGADDAARDDPFADLLEPSGEDGPMARLERISLSNAALVLHDEATGLTWSAPDTDLTLDLDDSAIVGHVSGDLQVRDVETRLDMQLFLHRESEMGSAAVTFTELNPAQLGFIAPELEEFSGIRIPLSGTIALELAAGGDFGGAEFDIAGGAGEVSLPSVFAGPVPVRRLAASGFIDRSLSRLLLDSSFVETDGPGFSLDGEIWQADAGIGVRGRLQARDMPFDTLDKYWPPSFIEGGRDWITENVSDGVITRIDAALDLAPGALEQERIPDAAAVGTLAFRNASMHYLRPMPAVEGVEGTGRFTGNSLDITMSGGRIAGISTPRGTAWMSDLQGDLPLLSVMVEAEGPAADALALLDHPRLALVSKAGLVSAGAGGTVSALFTVDLPMLKAVEFEQIDVTAVARIRDARMEEIAGMVDMTEGSLRLGVDTASMDLHGTARLEGMPATVAWQQHFDSAAPFAQRFDVSMTATPEGQTLLGLDLTPYLQGDLALDAQVTDPGDGAPPRAAFRFDMTDAALEVPEVSFSKPAGEPGTAHVHVVLPPDGPVDVTGFEVETGSLHAFGRASFARGLDHFGGDAPFTQGLDASMTVTAKDGAGLGPDLAPYVQGTPSLEAHLADPGGGEPPHATFLLDMTEATLEIPELSWSKPAGEPGTLEFRAVLPPDGPVELARIELETETLHAHGRATLARGLDHFGGSAPFTQGLDASITLTPRSQTALGLDLAPYMRGAPSLEARLADPGGGAPPSATFVLDMMEAALEFPELSWSKPAGEPGTVHVNAVIPPDGSIELARVELETETLHVVGRATLARGLDHFGGDAPFMQGLDASMTVTPKDRTALDLDLAPYVQGVPSLEAHVTDPGAGEPPHATLLLDMMEARLEIPDLYWSKPAGEPATVRIRAVLPADGPIELARVELETETLYALGRATLANGPGAVRDVTIERMQYGATDISGTIEIGDGTTRVSIRGASLDAQPYLDGLMDEGAPDSGHLLLDLDIERVVTADERQLTDVRARFETNPEGGHAGFMVGTLEGGSPLHFSLEQRNSKRLLTVRSRDAGAVARTFDIYDNAVGGDLLMEAVLHDDLPGEPVTGTVTIKDYTVTGASTLATLLTVATLTGILDALQGDGISFSRLVLPFSIEDDVLTIEKARTSGFSLGVNAEGTVDLESERVNVRGTIVPAYGLNSLVGTIPLVGEFLTGGEGGGLFAANYAVGGTIDDPNVSVNPLSILAPGILRELFSFPEESEE